MKFILDFAILCTIAVCIWSGYKKGLIMGVGGILVLIISMIAGNILSAAYSQEVLPIMRPFASGYMDKLITEGVYKTLGIEESEYSIDDLLEQNPGLRQSSAENALAQLGLHEDVSAELSLEAAEFASASGASLADSITEALCSKLAFAIGFLLFFLLVSISLTVIGNITNLSFRIPYLGAGNEIGGAVCGLVEGLLICFVAAWVLRFAGLFFPDGVLDGTWILSMLMNLNPLALFLGI